MKLPSLIKKQPCDSAKLETAWFGRELTPLMRFASLFLTSEDGEWQNRMRRRKWTEQQIGDFRSNARRRFAAVIFDAVSKRDSDAIFKLGEFLKEKPKSAPEDEWRVTLIWWKMHIEEVAPGYTTTVKEAARYLRYTGNMDVFRRLLREVNYPIRKDPGGRPGKTPTAKRPK